MEVNLYKVIRFPREELDHEDENEVVIIDENEVVAIDMCLIDHIHPM